MLFELLIQGIRLLGKYASELKRLGLPDLVKSLEIYYPKLNGGKDFSNLDFSEAYLQIQVDEEGPELFTINTPKRLYKLIQITFQN